MQEGDDRPRCSGRSINVFVSHRHDDGSGRAGRLADTLSSFFGQEQVYFDLESAVPGSNFVSDIESRLDSCAALLVIIGTEWRVESLSDPSDWVRFEISRALSAGIMVVPVLVAGATMPRDSLFPTELRPVAQVEAVEIRDKKFRGDADALAVLIERHVIFMRDKIVDRIRSLLNAGEFEKVIEISNIERRRWATENQALNDLSHKANDAIRRRDRVSLLAEEGITLYARGEALEATLRWSEALLLAPEDKTLQRLLANAETRTSQQRQHRRAQEELEAAQIRQNLIRNPEARNLRQRYLQTRGEELKHMDEQRLRYGRRIILLIFAASAHLIGAAVGLLLPADMGFGRFFFGGVIAYLFWIFAGGLTFRDWDEISGRQGLSAIRIFGPLGMLIISAFVYFWGARACIALWIVLLSSFLNLFSRPVYWRADKSKPDDVGPIPILSYWRLNDSLWKRWCRGNAPLRATGLTNLGTD